MTDLVPHLVAWESTRACNLACVHCRAEAQRVPHPDQLTTDEAIDLVDQISALANKHRPNSPVIFIISGGDPLMREDIFHIAEHATEAGLRTVMSPSGTQVTGEIIKKIKDAGIVRISISLDGSSAEEHDAFRQVPGAFEMATTALRHAKEGDLPFQINTTVTKRNLFDLPAILEKAVELGASAWDVFMLVPTGRGKVEDEISPRKYEETLEWAFKVAQTAPIPVKVTCAPHYKRIQRQTTATSSPVAQRRGNRKAEEGKRGTSHSRRSTLSRGCLAGNGFCFVSHVGEVFPCGYLPVLAGNIRQQPFKEIYQNSELFKELRDYNLLKGKCGICEYNKICGGCRARAFGATGDYLAEEPYCVYQPIRAAVQS